MPVPTSPAIANGGVTAGRVFLTASASGSGINQYQYQIATDAAFTLNVILVQNPTATAIFANLAPSTTYYARAAAFNASGSSAYSAAINFTTPALGTLDYVEYASVVVDNTITVSLRSDGGTVPVIQLGYSSLLDGTVWTLIATVPTTLGTDFGNSGGGRHDFALVTDPSGNLFVIGRQGTTSNVLVKRYGRTATTTWAASGQSAQAITSWSPLSFTAAYVNGTGASPQDSILLLTAGTDSIATPMSHGWATINPALVAASSATPFINSGTSGEATWAPLWGAHGNGIDIRRISSTGNRLAIYSRAVLSIVDVVNGGVPTPYSRTNMGGTVIPSLFTKSRVIVVDANTVATISGRGTSGLVIDFYTTAGTLLGSATYAAANVWGATVTDQWDAFYEPLSGSVRIFYIADDSVRKIERIDVNPTTFGISALTVVSSILGAVSSTNGKLRIPRGPVDERRIFLESANLLTGVKSVAAYTDTAAEVAPSAPGLPDVTSFDATAAFLFSWTFGDPNVNDVQTAYELQIQRVSDSVDVVSTGKVVSAVSSRSVAGATLTNGVSYRWRVRTYDAQDAVGAWSSYDAFSTSASGTLTITTPAADNPAGLNTATVPIVWSYTQPNGYVQTQRRVRLIRVSDSFVLSDTTMQASVATSYNVPAIPSGVPVRIELTIVTNAPGTPTIGPTNRLLTTNYASPTVPTAVLTLGVACIVITTTNPVPTGDEPLPILNLIERRLNGTTDAFVAVASIAPNGVYRDHAVRSATQYDYRVRAVTA